MSTKTCLQQSTSREGNRRFPIKSFIPDFRSSNKLIAPASAVDLRHALNAARKTFKKDMKTSSHSTPGTLSPKLGFVSCGITLSAPVSPSKSAENSGSEENRDCTIKPELLDCLTDQPAKRKRRSRNNSISQKGNEAADLKETSLRRKTPKQSCISEADFGEKRRPSHVVSMNEVIKLHQDEGVMNLLHALPASRRRVPLMSFSNSRTSNSYQNSPEVSKPSRKQASPNTSKHELARQEPIAALPDQVASSTVEVPLVRGRKLIKMEDLTNPVAMNFLKTLQSKPYIRSWSSHSRFFISHEASQTSSGIPNICRGSSSSPNGSVNSDLSSVSNVQFRVQQRLQFPALTSSWTAVAKNYKDIIVKQHETYAQIVLNTSSTGLKNALSPAVCNEVIDALKLLEEERSCVSVVFTGMGRIFCQGVDLSLLTYESVDKQRRSAESIAYAIKKLLSCIIAFPKVIVAAVNGTARGFGVTMLPFFDMVYASDRAEFRTDYGKLGQTPEGCPAHTLIGNHLILNELFLFSKRLTACEAINYGLVTTVIWSDKFFETVLPKVARLGSSPSEGLVDVRNNMKRMLRKNVTMEVLEEDTKQLIKSWTRQSYPARAKAYLNSTEWVF